MNVEVRDQKTGNTPLFFLSYQSPKYVPVLLGANPNARNQGGYTPLRAAILPMFTDYRPKTTATVELLLAAGADVNALDGEGETPLLVASRYVRVSEPIIHLLLDRGADVKGADLNGQTVLHRSVNGGSTELIGRLIKLGVMVDSKDKDGNTPLSYAVSETNNLMPDDLERNLESFAC